jgi:DNA-binding FadR family transcriptional regulator
MLTNERLRHPKMARTIADKVRTEIATGKLPRGSRLPAEPELIARYGVSRGVIREALRLLEASGLVDVRRGPKGGAIITHPDPAQVRDVLVLSLQLGGVRLGGVYDALMAIEPAAARLAAGNRPKETEAALLAHTEQQAHLLDDVLAFADALNRFHEVMVVNCGNDALTLVTESLMQTISCTTEPISRMVLRQIGNEGYRVGGHAMLQRQRHLAQVIGSGDGAVAEAEWRSFMKGVADRFFTLIPRDLELL